MGIRVAFDASSLAKRERTGIARYGTCLIEALCRVAPLDEVVLGYRLSRWKRRRHAYRGPAEAPVRTRYFTDAALGWTLGRHDVFHGLDARIPARPRAPTVATIHDVSQLLQPEIATQGFRDRKSSHLAHVAARADRIVCVSEGSRRAFAELFGLGDDARLRVVHHGVEPRFRPVDEATVTATLDRLGARPPYLLFVGLLSSRKNIVRLIEAFDLAAPQIGAETRLVLAGGRGHGYDDVRAAIDRSAARERIVEPGFVADDDLPALYNGATAFLFPGRAEGFGMPMLEAMACGTPVLAHDNEVSREVAGEESALRVDCEVVDALADGIARVGGDDDLRRKLIDAGARRAEAFSWDEAARRTYEVYREIASG